MEKVIRSLPKPLQSALSKKEIFTQALFERPESLSSFLPYEEYIPDQEIFRNKDGSLGAVFEADLLEHETMTSSEVVAAVQGLKSWFSLPENCSLQVHFEQSYVPSFDGKLERIRASFPEGNLVSKVLFRERMQQISSACNSDSVKAPMVRRALIAIRYFPTGSTFSSLKHVLKRGESVLFTEMKEFVQEMRNFGQILVNYQHNSKVALRRLNAGELLDFLRRFFNPRTYYSRSFAPFNPNVSLSEQVLYSHPTLDYAGIEREGVKTRTLSLKTSPQFAYPGGMAYFLKLPFPFKLSLSFSFPTKARSKAFFDLKEFFLQNTPSARARRQREEVLEVQEKLARDDRCLHLTFNVVLEGESDEILEKRVRDVVNVFHNDLDCETIVEEDVGLGLCLNSLPLNYAPSSDHSTQRHIRILKSDATCFVPVFDSFRGLKTPLSVHLSRENNLVGFSLLENETSNHTVVVADTGSGKSAFIIDCILAAKRMKPEPMVFVVDKKSSYRMVAEYFDGDLTLFDANREMPFTPFRGVYDQEKINFLTQLFEAAIKLTSPAFEFDSIHKAAIDRALRGAFEKKVEQAKNIYVQGEIRKKTQVENIELTMEDFIAELAMLPSDKTFENLGRQVQEVIERLLPFYGEGTYAQYFKGAKSAPKDRDPSFFIYDLDGLDSNPVAQALMTMAVVEEIRQKIKLPENQGRGGFIVLEELGMLGRDNPIASRFILDAAETFRKLGFWLIGLTPRPQNYFELEAGRAMWSVADNFVFLQMNADNVDYLAKNSSLFDEANTEIIKSLRTIKGSHADVFYMNKTKSVQGAFRYIQMPSGRWMAPTNMKDAQMAIQALKQFKNEKWEALKFLAEKYPRGVESGAA